MHFNYFAASSFEIISFISYDWGSSLWCFNTHLIIIFESILYWSMAAAFSRRQASDTISPAGFHYRQHMCVPDFSITRCFFAAYGAILGRELRWWRYRISVGFYRWWSKRADITFNMPIYTPFTNSCAMLYYSEVKKIRCHIASLLMVSPI